LHKWNRLLLAAATGLALTLPAALIWAAPLDSGTGRLRPNRQAFKFRTTPITTTSERFKRNPGLRALQILNRGPVTASVSAVFGGAPVDVRVKEAGAPPLRPGTVHFAPSCTRAPFTFIFADHGKRPANCRTYAVEWRSPSGQQVVLRRADLILTYRFDDTDKGLRFACA
jgi:hypothetical protein